MLYPVELWEHGTHVLKEAENSRFRAEREINWSKRRASAVQVLDAVNWGA